MNITDLDLLIMDECHHTDLCHPYAAIMEAYYTVRRQDTHARLPQIIGLTASLGVGSDDADPAQHYVHICANLDCDLITHVKENREELERYVPRLKRDHILAVAPRPKHTPFRGVVIMMMDEIRKMKEMKSKCVDFDYGTQPFENWAVQVGLRHFVHCLTVTESKLQFYNLTALGLLKNYKVLRYSAYIVIFDTCCSLAVVGLSMLQLTIQFLRVTAYML